MRQFIDLIEGIDSPKTRPSLDDIERIRYERERLRKELGGGQCLEMSDWIEGEFGWPRYSGTYTDPHDEPICDAHVWNVLPDGAILDSTADQFGEGHDIRIIEPDSDQKKQYRDEWYSDYYPGHPEFPALKGREWSGVYDRERTDQLRNSRGYQWWTKTNSLDEAMAFTPPDAIYRWVDAKGARSYIRTNTMVARWQHYLPAKLTGERLSKFYTGLSFSDNLNRWSIAGDICFVLNQQTIDQPQYTINGQSIYTLSDIQKTIMLSRGQIISKAEYVSALNNAIVDSRNDPDEIFVVGNVTELSQKLIKLVCKKVEPKTHSLLQNFAQRYDIPLEII